MGITINGTSAYTAVVGAQIPKKIKLSDSESIKDAVKTGRADSIILSDEARQKLDTLGKQVAAKNEAASYSYYMKTELENSKKQAEAMSNDAENKLKMMEIARRLSNGDKVPFQDERALMEYDDKIYQLSKMSGLMKQNERRKEYDTLLEEEKPIEGQEIAPPELSAVEITAAEGEPAQAADITEVPLE